MTNILGPRLAAALTRLFNALSLNLVLLLACLPLITAPVAIASAAAALDQWQAGEDRVVRTFATEFRARWTVPGVLGLGVPLAAIACGAAEVRHFARALASGTHLAPATSLGPGTHLAPASLAALILGAAALLITLSALGYLIQLSAANPALPPVDLWSASARLALRNLPLAAPLTVLPIAGLTVLALRDPAVLLLGLPLFLLHALKLIARPAPSPEPQ